MANAVPNSYKLAAISGTIAPATDTLKIALLNSSFVPNIDTQQFFGDVNANEVSGAGYTAGGNTLASKTLTQDNTNDRGVLDAADSTWSTLTAANIAYAVIYKSTGNNATSPILCILDLGGSQSQTGANFTVQFDAAGVLYLG